MLKVDKKLIKSALNYTEMTLNHFAETATDSELDKGIVMKLVMVNNLLNSIQQDLSQKSIGNITADFGGIKSNEVQSI